MTKQDMTNGSAMGVEGENKLDPVRRGRLPSSREGVLTGETAHSKKGRPEDTLRVQATAEESYHLVGLLEEVVLATAQASKTKKLGEWKGIPAGRGMRRGV